MIPGPPLSQSAHSPASSAWPADFTAHQIGTGCPMCENDFDTDDIGCCDGLPKA